VADTSLSRARVVRQLDAIIAARGRPKTIVSNNGPELTSTAVLARCERTRVDWNSIAPGKPTQNAFVEGLNGCALRLRARTCRAARAGRSRWPGGRARWRASGAGSDDGVKSHVSQVTTPAVFRPASIRPKALRPGKS
jgi:transposase InsO family protein